MTRLSLRLTGFFLSAAAIASPAVSPRDARVAAIADRLGHAALPWCPQAVALFGWQLRYIDDYDPELRADVAAAFAMDQGPNLLAVVPGSPAARAGLHPGDTLLMVGDLPVPTSRTAGERRLAALPTDVPTSVALLRGGERVGAELQVERGCPSTVRLVPTRDRNAFSDGHAVIASTAIVDLAADDAELATLLAHEFAHNYLRHGVATAAAPPPAILRREEAEADRFSLYLLAAAGYDPAAAPRFWSRLLRDTHRIASGYGSHAPKRARLRAFREEIARIKAAPRLEWNGVPARPD